MAFFRSEGFAAHGSKAIAFEGWFPAVEEAAILGAESDDPESYTSWGLFGLEHFAEPDIDRARPSLNAAATLGHVNALVELALITLFSPQRPIGTVEHRARDSKY